LDSFETPTLDRQGFAVALIAAGQTDKRNPCSVNACVNAALARLISTVNGGLFMNNRRHFLATASAMAATGFSVSAAAKNNVLESEACAVYDKQRQAAMTPDNALQVLKAGNERFLAGKSINCDLMAQVRATGDGQAPFAAVVGCIDSRVPPELVFDQKIGDIFAARVAGNFMNTDIIGSLEFAAKLAGSKLIVVLGHSECGAVKGAVDNAKLGNLTAMLANITPAVEKTTGIEGPRSSKNKKLVQAVADVNAQDAARHLLERSAVLRDMVAAGELKVVAAMHNVHTGKVTWFS
jgi:carbonic anhydrase